jgi:drug/metabolite transporter (DMT)-like permease
MNKKAKIALIATMLIWSSSYVAIRIGLQGYSAGSLGLLRYSIAAVIMVIVYFRLPKRSKINLKDGVSIFLTGSIGIGAYNVALNYGEHTVNAAVAGFLISAIPVITMVLAVIIYKEKVSIIGIIGILISISGISLIFISESSGHGNINWGVLIILISVACGSFYILMQKKLLKKYNPIELAALCIISSAIIQLIFLPSLIGEISHAPIKTSLSAIYLGIFPASCAYLAWSYALKHIPITKASSVLYALPFFTLLLGWLVLGELPMWLSLIGGVMSLFGAFIIGKYNSQNK